MVIALLATLTGVAQTDDFNPTNPPEPEAKYRLTVTAEPAEAATMSGWGQYSEGASVTARATARTNYVFKHWLQNGTQLSSTSTSLKITMPAEDVSLVAVFEYQEPEEKPFDPANPAEPQTIDVTYKLYLVADPAGGGSFNRTSGKTAKEGETINLRATAATDYQFVGWYDSDGTQLSTSATMNYVMPAKHTTLTARFEYSPVPFDPANPSEPTGSQDDIDNTEHNITFADAATEEICVSHWDKNNNGKLSEGEAAAVTSLENAFTGSDIETFNELAYFTGLSMIEADGFRNCKKLTALTLPEGLSEIGDNAFTNCPKLTKLHLPASLSSISDQSVFHYCLSLTAFTVDAANASFCADNGVLYNKDKTRLICCPATKKGTFTIPATVETIEISAFAMCTGLTTITLPKALKRIGEAAFVGCSGLTTMDFTPQENNNYLTIGIGCFNGCSSMTAFTVGGSKDGTINDLLRLIDGVLFGTWTNSNGKLNSLDCYPANHGSTYVVPEGVTSITYYAFCLTGISEVTLPSTLRFIGDYAFAYCENLTKVTAKATLPYDCEYAFDSNAGKATLYVPSNGTKEIYQTTPGWSKFGTYVGGSGDITVFANDTKELFFKVNGTNSVALIAISSKDGGKVEIPAQVSHGGKTYTVTEIGSGEEKEVIEGVDGVVRHFDYSLFEMYGLSYYNKGVTEVVIPNTVKGIGNSAFFWYGLGNKFTSVTSLVEEPFELEEFRFYWDLTATLYVPAGTKALYMQAAGWEIFEKIEELGTVKRGDANGDGVVNLNDVNKVADFIMTGNGAGFFFTNADMNGDETINAIDLVEIINIKQ